MLVCASVKEEHEEWAPDASDLQRCNSSSNPSDGGSFGFQVSILVPQVLHNAASMHMVGEGRLGD